ncbi:MAG: NERD domain-containing protein [Gammaproteobacteria bacterium]|nr:NERD domain-containing protein [Gammaproteobacteria bacterium]
MNPDQILKQLKLESDLVALAITGLAILLVLLVNRKRLLVKIREWRIQRSLAQIGCEQIRNLVCSDGLDGYFKLDRLALTPDAIVLITYKLHSGNIYCAEHISQWTQLVGQKSYKFDNPLFELENQLTALRLLTGNAHLEGFLFFNNSAQFPKGHPDQVLQSTSIPERFNAANCDNVKPEITAAWELLKAHQKQISPADHASVNT